MKKYSRLVLSRRSLLGHSSKLLLVLAAGGFGACSNDNSGQEPNNANESANSDAATLPEQVAEALNDAANPDNPGTGATYPRMIVPKGVEKGSLQSKFKEEPFASIYKSIQDRAKSELKTPSKDKWNHRDHGHNGQIAEANAFLAWLNDDKASAERALKAMDMLATNWRSHGVWDINIRMPEPLMSYSTAYDLLRGTEFFPKADQEKLQDKLLTIATQFYEDYVVNDGTRGLVLTPAQNNHPIRTACAIGFVGLTFWGDKRSQQLMDWALSELDYLWGANGQYVMADGGVTEGPHYYAFALAPSITFFIALENSLPKDAMFKRSCVNRSNLDPWKGHGCKDGESFAFENPLRTQYFLQTIEWSLAQRIWQGQRAPIADSNFTNINGPSILTGFGAPSYHYWDWSSNPRIPFKTSGGYGLSLFHLIYTPKPQKVEPPPWNNKFFDKTGLGVFRSGWDIDAISLLLIAESGSSRKTLHDHVDGTSFLITAYDEPLVIDTGYHKKGSLDNPITADPPSHNVLMIGGKGAPKKGVLNRWGDADAFLEHSKDGKAIAWSEARQTYEKTTIVRGVAFVRQRYFVMVDRLKTTHDKPREHGFRLHAYAGYDLKETKVDFTNTGLHIERKKAGMFMHMQVVGGTLEHKEPPYKKNQVPHVHKVEGKVADHFVSDSVVTAVEPHYLTVFAPYKMGEAPGSLHAPLDVTSVDCGEDAVGWLIKTSEGTDFAWLRGAKAKGSVELPGGTKVETDAAFALCSLDGKSALISRGKKLMLDGKPLVDKDASQGVEILES